MKSNFFLLSLLLMFSLVGNSNEVEADSNSCLNLHTLFLNNPVKNNPPHLSLIDIEGIDKMTALEYSLYSSKCVEMGVLMTYTISNKIIQNNCQTVKISEDLYDITEYSETSLSIKKANLNSSMRAQYRAISDSMLEVRFENLKFVPIYRESSLETVPETINCIVHLNLNREGKTEESSDHLKKLGRSF